MVIFAVTNGYLDDVPVDQIRAWEQGFRDFMAAQHPDLGEEIRTRKVLGDDLTPDCARQSRSTNRSPLADGPDPRAAPADQVRPEHA